METSTTQEKTEKKKQGPSTEIRNNFGVFGGAGSCVPKRAAGKKCWGWRGGKKEEVGQWSKRKAKANRLRRGVEGDRSQN